MIGKGIRVIDRFMESVGLYEKVFGKLLDPLVRDTPRERAKLVLRSIYGYNDIDILFPPNLDKEELRIQTKLLMQTIVNEENNKK